MEIPGHKGSKKEITKKIEALYNIKIEKDTTMSNSIAQSLSKYFAKIPQEYCLSNEIDLNTFNLDRPNSMKEMIISSLLSLSRYKGGIKEIKNIMQIKFGDQLNN